MFKKSITKKILAFVLSILMLLPLSPQNSSAGGVQLYQYATSFNLQPGIWVACCWNNTSNAGGVVNPDGTKTWYALLGASPWLSAPQAYSQVISGTINGPGSSYYLSETVYVQGTKDGVNWTTLSYMGTGNSGNFSVITGENWNQIRVWGIAQQYSYQNTYSPYYSGGTINLNIYSSAADQATAQSALDAANAANAAAQNASTQASNASSYANQALNWLNGTWGGYNLGTVGNYANQAVNWLNGTWGGYSLGTVGQNATKAMNNSWDTSTSLSAATLARQARDNASQAVSTLNTTNSNISDLQTSVNNLQTSVNNVASLFPPTLTKVSGYNNASATSTSSFNVSLDYSNANEYSFKIDSGGWSTWSSLSSHDSLGYLTVSGISGSGSHTIYIQIRQNNGGGTVSPVAKGKLSIFKL